MRWLALSALAGLLAAAEQPLILPMPALLQRLDPTQEWLFLPWADYQALRHAAAVVPTPSTVPHGAWISQAIVSGTIHEDREVRCQGELVIDSVDAGAQRCPLFSVSPGRLGDLVLDGVAALTIRQANGAIELLVPGPGRHRASITWTIALQGDERRRDGALPLPLGAAGLVSISSDSVGMLVAPQLALAGERRWQRAGATPEILPLTWAPGASASGVSVWGIDQTLIIDGGTWSWLGLPGSANGLPGQLDLELPAGMTLTAHSAGVHDVSGGPTGQLTLRVDPQATRLELQGILAPASAIALPRFQAAAWQGGAITLRGAGASDPQTPPRWRLSAAAGDGSSRTWQVPGPDAGLTMIPVAPTHGLAVVAEHHLDANPERWQLTTQWTIHPEAQAHFALPLRLPVGWQVITASSDPPCGFSGLDPDSTTGEAATLLPSDGLRQARCIRLVLEREPADGILALPMIAGAARASQQLTVAEHEVELALDAPGWQAGIGAALHALGSPPPLNVAARKRAAEVEAEAVIYLQPRAADGSAWCRIDLQVTVAGGSLSGIELAAPFAVLPTLSGQGWRLSRRGDSFELTAAQPWTGERHLRLEGELPSGEGRLTLPRLRIQCHDGSSIRLRQHVALQLGDRFDLDGTPGPAALALDPDDLPRWSRPIPGEPLAAAWTLQAGDAGALTLIARPLAPALDGFIDQAIVRTQLDAVGHTTWFHCRLAAPGLATLALGLPSGCTLLAASLDRQPVAIRQDGGEPLLTLPGRTHCELTLLYRGPIGARTVQLPLPRLGDLPLTDVTWTTAADSQWQIVAPPSNDALPLRCAQPAYRAWFSPWQGAASESAAPVAIVCPRPHPMDPRQLPVLGVAAPPALQDLTLTLSGQQWQGQRSGGGVLRLEWQSLDALRTADRLGTALAILCGAALALAGGCRRALVISAAGLAGAAALHGAGLSAGPALAFCEWLLPATVAALLLRLCLVRRTAS